MVALGEVPGLLQFPKLYFVLLSSLVKYNLGQEPIEL